MKNLDIREYAVKNNVRLWQVAQELHINDGNFSRKLRVELSQEEKQKIKDIIDNLSPNKNTSTTTIACPFCGEEVLYKRFCSECGEMLKEIEE